MSIDWGSMPDWIVAAATVFGVGAGLTQLSAIRRTNHQAAQFERAKLILDFDREFESESISASRYKLLALRNRFEAEVAAIEPPMTVEKQIGEVASRMSRHVTDVWHRSRTYDGDPMANKDSSAEEYSLMMRLPSWCETLGHQCQRNLISLDDVLDLYDQLVINTIGNLAEHIQFRIEQRPHQNSRYLEHAMWLYREAKKHKLAKEQRIAKNIAASRVEWDD